MDRPDDVLAGVVEQLPIGVFALDPDGRVVLWNRRAEQLTGWDRANMVGVGLLDTPVDTPSIVRILDELRAGRPFTGRFPVRAGAGPTLYFRAVPTTLSGTAVLGVLQDVVDSRAGDEAFALLDALWEHAPVGLAYFDTELRYRRGDGAVLDIDGGTVDERLGQTLEQVHGETGRVIAEGPREVLADGRPRPAPPRPAPPRRAATRPDCARSPGSPWRRCEAGVSSTRCTRCTGRAGGRRGSGPSPPIPWRCSRSSTGCGRRRAGTAGSAPGPCRCAPRAGWRSGWARRPTSTTRCAPATASTCSPRPRSR